MRNLSLTLYRKTNRDSEVNLFRWHIRNSVLRQSVVLSVLSFTNIVDQTVLKPNVLRNPHTLDNRNCQRCL